MREDRRDDLVSTTAIVAGTVVGIAATVMSLWLSAEESSTVLPALERPVPVVIDVDAVRPAPVEEREAADAWTDPRGAERGPSEAEWEVIRAYETIESMTADEPGNEAVDVALVELGVLAWRHRENPFIQEIHLKAIRVANYWAFESGDLLRAALLHARFERVAELAPRHDLTVRERMRMLAQRIEQRCDDADASLNELRALSLEFPNEHTAAVLETGVTAAATCRVGATP